ncbi:DinB superfamily protein [Flavivirga aquatica]|uniref:DinB superfamily protein n=1 Tax=Flavivirga aquatica TaxID=1849968 RepID=A0A1E5SH99_9FLAO|nr:DinB family protein [Flavivirga aquatica]OEJ98484.1 DinB superfamily protein [Flavivirga aquatica]
MLKDTLIKIFKNDLNKLKHEITCYKNEANLWIIEKEVSNSAGNLCLHIIGNLNHFIGSVLGNTRYIRKRDLEFSLKNVSKLDLIKQIDDTIKVVEDTLNRLSINDLEKQYPITVYKEPMTTEYFLTYLTTHLVYHLGQITYHRRLLDS